MCYPSSTKSATSSQVLATYKAHKALKPVKANTFVWLYANDNNTFSPYHSGSILSLVESAFVAGVEMVEYSTSDATPFVVIFDHDDGIYLQVNCYSGVSRRLISREVVASDDMVYALALPHIKEAEDAEKKRIEDERASNLASMKRPVYDSLTWVVESTDYTNPHPFRFNQAVQPALESAFQSYQNGGFHLFAYGRTYQINFKTMTQTNCESKVERKLERIPCVESSSSSSSPSQSSE